jgi:hypothetical protein
MGGFEGVDSRGGEEEETIGNVGKLGRDDWLDCREDQVMENFG